VAQHLGVGLIELRKEPWPSADVDTWLIARTPPDYQDRNLALGIRANLLTPGTRVLFVDDWVDTGGWTATIEQPRPTPMDHNRD